MAHGGGAVMSMWFDARAAGFSTVVPAGVTRSLACNPHLEEAPGGNRGISVTYPRARARGS